MEEQSRDRGAAQADSSKNSQPQPKRSTTMLHVTGGMLSDEDSLGTRREMFCLLWGSSGGQQSQYLGTLV